MRWNIVFEVHQHTYLKVVTVSAQDVACIARMHGFFASERKSTKEDPTLWGSDFQYLGSDAALASHWIPYHMIKAVTRVREADSTAERDH